MPISAEDPHRHRFPAWEVAYYRTLGTGAVVASGSVGATTARLFIYSLVGPLLFNEYALPADTGRLEHALRMLERTFEAGKRARSVELMKLLEPSACR